MVPNTSQEHFSTTLHHSTSTQHSFTTLLLYYCVLRTTKYYKVTPRPFDLQNDVRTTSIQYYSVLQSTTTYYKTTIQYYSVLQSTTKYYSDLRKKPIQYYSLLQSTTEASKTLTFKATSFQNEHFLRTTKYYKGTLRPCDLQNDVRTTSIQYYTYYSVLQSTTKYYSDLRKKPIQYYSLLQSTTEASKTSTFEATSFQNEHFLRTTKYYKVTLRPCDLQNDVRTTSIQYYSVLQSTTTYYKTTIQYYSVLQSTTKYYSDLRNKPIQY